MKSIKSDNSTNWKTFLLMLIIPGLAVFTSGCDEGILDVPPYGQTTSEDFWRNADDAEAAVNAIYAPLATGNLWGHRINTLLGIPEDDQYRAGDHGVHSDIENFTYDSSHPYFDSTWRSMYEIINRSNDILINVPDINMDQGLKNRILGEAYFMRGFSYWYLSKLFGGMPLILEQDVIDNNFNKPRATLEQTQNQIESDLQQAAELLHLTHSGNNVGRPNKGSAWGYLTKLYVFQERFQDAITAGNQVINGPYPLAQSFEDNFKIATQYNPEILFTVAGAQGWNAPAHRIYSAPRPWGGWDFHAPLPDLLNEYEDDDPRQGYSIMRPGDVFDLGGDRGLTDYTADLSPSTGYHFQKFSEWREAGGLSGDSNIPLMRSAEVYLYVAEAKIRLGQNGDTELNAVLLRSGLAPVNNATMQHIIHERRVELAGENKRHFDLMRWDKANIVDIVAIYGEDRGPFDPPRNFVRPRHYYYAVPQNQIDISGGVLDQNPGH